MLALVIETWVWYGVVVAVSIGRFIARILHLGSIRRLQTDDWLMAFALCTYTTVIVTINIVANKDTNLFPPDYDVNNLTSADVQQRQYGSKLVLVVEQCQCLTTWSAKACLLIMFARLTVGRKEHILLKVLAVYIAFGFIFMEVFYFGVWCRPFHNYWAVPTPNIQCSAAINHLITNAVFNLSSDIIMLCIALPVFIRSRLPLRKKLVLIGIFSLGFFVILAAILNKYYSFTQPFGSLWTFWYTREVSTALLVTNLPFIWTLLRRLFGVRSLDGGSRTTQTGPLGMTRPGTNRPQYGVDPRTGRHLSCPPKADVEDGRPKWLDEDYDLDVLRKPAPTAKLRQSSTSEQSASEQTLLSASQDEYVANHAPRR